MGPPPLALIRSLDDAEGTVRHRRTRTPNRGATERRRSYAGVRLQLLLLDKVHNRHDDGRLRQLDAQLRHHRPEMCQELIERLLALPDIEDLQLAIFTEAGVELHRALGAPTSRRRSRPLVCCSAVMFLVTM